MILTAIYIITTMMQLRKISYLKKYLEAAFNQNRPSIMLYITSLQHPSKGHNDNGKEDRTFMSSHLCSNKDLVKLDELLWYGNNINLCTVYPVQLVDVSDWLAYPQGKTLFPLDINNCYQCTNISDSKINILVEANLETYKYNASQLGTKLEDYGLIRMWTVNKNINFLLESDADRVMNLLTIVMQGQFYINNDLCITRIQSVLVSGEPCIYNGQLNSILDNNLMYVLSDTARVVKQQMETIELIKYGVKVHPGKQDSSNAVPTLLTSTGNQNTGISDTLITSNATSATICAISTANSSRLQQTATSENVDLATLQSLSTWEKEVASTVDASSSINKQIRFGSGGHLIILDPISSAHAESGQRERTASKPPNVVIYAESQDAINNIKTVLTRILDSNRYIIYALTRDEARSSLWIDQVALAVVCGNVEAEISAQLVEYVIQGGKLLALCSDILHTLLPSFKTAEVRESELVHFSYGKWKRVRMMHHIFCYHASPIRARFFQDQEDTRTSALNPPTSTSVKDKRGKFHSFDVKILGTEETWQNPSILLATLANSRGRVVFSQIHLEVDPTQYEYEEDKFEALKQNDVARLEIISDLLNTHLGMETTQNGEEFTEYTPAYFLGMYEAKQKMLEKLKSKLQENDVLKMKKLNIRFYANSIITTPASASFLPIMVHMCPTYFSTLKYYENLDTSELGRLVIYTDVLVSSMHVVDSCLEHGVAVIPRQQTQGLGRGRNTWLSPIGCAMFSLQIHISKDSVLGGRIPLLQHAAAVAIISAVRSMPGYEDIDLRLKWPNDIYNGNSTKIGGLMISVQAEDSLYICNIGAGINLFNSKPTTCINDIIEQYNRKYNKRLFKFSHEQYLALIFNELENLLDIIQNNNTQHFYDLYYKYWLHTNSKVTVLKSNGKAENVKITGINDDGYLLVQTDNGTTFSVQSDGNSFDVLKGLIAPKHN